MYTYQVVGENALVLMAYILFAQLILFAICRVEFKYDNGTLRVEK